MALVPRFRAPLQVEYRRDGRWKLLAPLVFESARLDKFIVVPCGFDTDFASVPRLPLMFWLMGDRVHGPAVVHDYLYRTELVSRADADAVFAEAMKAEGVVGTFTRWAMWFGVRVGGSGSYGPRHPANYDVDLAP